MAENKAASLREGALHFHQFPKPGKLEIVATKPLANARDLSLAYSPGVAIPCEEIAAELGSTPGAVMTQVFRARQKLKAALGGYGEEARVYELP